MKLKTALAVPVVAAAAALAPGALAENGSQTLGNEANGRSVGLDGAGTAAARRADDNYKGKFTASNQNGSKITIKAATKKGKPTKVLKMTYLARMDCETTGPNTGGSAGWVFNGGLQVQNRKFKIVNGSNGQTPESTLTFKGKFSKNGKSVKGTFTTSQYFEEQADPPLPAETCTLDNEKYKAQR